MKIGDVTGSQGIERSVETSRDKGAVKGDEFKRLMDAETAARSGPASAAGIAPFDMIDSLSGISPVSLGGGSEESEMADSIESAMSSFENVEKSLKDPTVSLKAIDRAISALSGEVDGLQDKLKDLPDGHPLKQIGAEMSVLAGVETVKWQRGDYL